MENFREWIEMAACGIEGLAVLLMVSLILLGSARWLLCSGGRVAGAYENYRMAIGKSLLVGLELLVAADIIRTVVLNTTLQNILALGALVLVRTFLGWTLTVEVEGHWPWQNKAKNRTAEAGAKTERS
jgi:uncharacterized membrane protein